MLINQWFVRYIHWWSGCEHKNVYDDGDIDFYCNVDDDGIKSEDDCWDVREWYWWWKCQLINNNYYLKCSDWWFHFGYDEDCVGRNDDESINWR